MMDIMILPSLQNESRHLIAENDSEHITVREDKDTRAMTVTVYPDECDSIAAEETFTSIWACKNWLFDHLNDKYNKE